VGYSWGPNCTKKSKARSTSGTGSGDATTCAASSVAVSWKTTWATSRKDAGFHQGDPGSILWKVEGC